MMTGIHEKQEIINLIYIDVQFPREVKQKYPQDIFSSLYNRLCLCKLFSGY